MQNFIIGLSLGLCIGVIAKKLGNFIEQKFSINYLGDEFEIDPTDWIGQI